MAPSTSSAAELTVYRVVLVESAERAYDGAEAREKGGRWSSPGASVVYAAGSLALALLEALVHLDPLARSKELAAVRARIPATVRVAECTRPPRSWDRRPPGCPSRLVGMRWLRSGRCAVLSVPSVIVPSERNYLIAPEHPDFGRIEISPPTPFCLDPRLHA